MDAPADHDLGMQRARRSLEGLSVGDAFGEQLLAEPATILRRMQRREAGGRDPAISPPSRGRRRP